MNCAGDKKKVNNEILCWNACELQHLCCVDSDYEGKCVNVFQPHLVFRKEKKSNLNIFSKCVNLTAIKTYFQPQKTSFVTKGELKFLFTASQTNLPFARSVASRASKHIYNFLWNSAT